MDVDVLAFPDCVSVIRAWSMLIVDWCAGIRSMICTNQQSRKNYNTLGEELVAAELQVEHGCVNYSVSPSPSRLAI